MTFRILVELFAAILLFLVFSRVLKSFWPKPAPTPAPLPLKLSPVDLTEQQLRDLRQQLSDKQAILTNTQQIADVKAQIAAIDAQLLKFTPAT